MFATHTRKVNQQMSTDANTGGSGNVSQAAQQLAFALVDAGRLYTRRFQKAARELPLNLTQCRVLLTLAHNEGITQQRLAHLTALNPAALGRLLERLEASEWVARRPCPLDRRARSLAITQRGWALRPRILRFIKESQLAALRDLSLHETQILTKALDRVLANLKAHPPSAHRTAPLLHAAGSGATSSVAGVPDGSSAAGKAEVRASRRIAG
jgi:DNA-binding MarR family transcriptional regulator